jgi:sortase B
LKTTDNDYYLNRNFYKEKDENGWVFMDYRNTIDELGQHTIIYAHNRYYSGVMFGTLNNVTKWKWYSKPENWDITFNTLYEEHTWRVFSIYSIDVTSDYLYTKFATKEEYQAFLDMIKNRSDISLKTKATTDDKILTLSTCLNGDRRLVVHAVLITEE